MYLHYVRQTFSFFCQRADIGCGNVARLYCSLINDQIKLLLSSITCEVNHYTWLDGLHFIIAHCTNVTIMN